MTSLPTNVQTKIDAYNAEKQSYTSAVSSLEQLIADKQTAIVSAQSDLAAATTAVLANPTSANSDAELAARKTVADLTAQIEGLKARRADYSTMTNASSKDAAIAAGQAALQAAQGDFDANQPAALQAIKDAKAAYLNALKSYHDIKANANQIFYETARQVSLNDRDIQTIGQPRFAELPIFYTQGSPNKIGVFEFEILDALDRGIVKDWSVEK